MLETLSGASFSKFKLRKIAWRRLTLYCVEAYMQISTHQTNICIRANFYKIFSGILPEWHGNILKVMKKTLQQFLQIEIKALPKLPAVLR